MYESHKYNVVIELFIFHHKNMKIKVLVCTMNTIIEVSILFKVIFVDLFVKVNELKSSTKYKFLKVCIFMPHLR